MPTLRRDAQAHRDALLAAAGALLGERGPGFSLTEVAQWAGVAQATAYRHFSDAGDVIAGSAAGRDPLGMVVLTGGLAVG